MAGLIRFRARKGQIIAIDSAYSVVMYVAIVAVCVSLISAASETHAQEMREQAMQAKAMSLADYLLKEGAAVKFAGAFGDAAKIHEIDAVAVAGLDMDKLAHMVGADSVCVDAALDAEHTVCGGVCARRAVLINGEGGFLVACVR